MRWSTWGIVIVVSGAVHAGAWVTIAAVPKHAARKTTTVAVVDKKKKDEKKDDKAKDEPPPPPPKPIEAPKRAAPKPKPAPENTPPPPVAAAKPSAASHPVLDALPNLGISMAGGPGGGGIAVPLPQADAPAGAKAPEGRGPLPKPKDECTEDAVKPKLTGGIPQGRVKAAAASAGVEGKIRLELMIDESGNVTSVRVISGLGGAIDAAAMADAKGARFTPGTKCGRPAAARLVISITVRNQD